jgi:hypothetical protein
MTKRVCTVSQAISTIAISSIESISLWLGISRTLSISIPGVSKTISTTIAKGGVAMSNTMTISKRVSTVSKTISTIAISSIKSISLRFWLSLSFSFSFWLSLSFSFSLTLGNMDSTNRVGNISASTSVTPMDSRDGSWSNAMDSYPIASMVDGCSVSKMSYTITKTKTRVSKMVSICTIESISLSTSKGCRANLEIKYE